MTLKIGKRYLRRDGSVTAPLTKYDSERYPFLDTDGENCYTIDGKFYYEESEGPSRYDLISEYKPEWRVVIKCDNRANARWLADRVKCDKPFFKITVEKS